MLTELRLTNFKAFGETQRIPIKPLTLIFGANSSGKSSIIHSLLLARHASDTGELDVFKTDIGGDSVDLGGIRQYTHRRETNRCVQLSVGLDSASVLLDTRQILPTGPLLLSAFWRIAGLNDEFDGELEGVPIGRAALAGGECAVGEKSLWRFRRHSASVLGLRDIDEVLMARLEDEVSRRMATMGLTPAEDQSVIKQTLSDVLPKLRFSASAFLPIELSEESRHHGAPQPSSSVSDSADREAAMRKTVAELSVSLLGAIVCQVNRTAAEELRRLYYLGPLRSYPPRHMLLPEARDHNWISGGGFAWEKLFTDDEVRKHVNDWLSSPKRLQTSYRLVKRRFVNPMDPIARELIDKAFEDAGKFSADENAEILATSLVKEERLSFVEDLVLVDQVSETPVYHRDVGIGVSQVLPVLVHAFADRDKLVAIEQPEIHLHPALQAELGDVFIESALGERKNTFLLETHSEHLILRILRRIRETAEGKDTGLPPVQPKDVSVLYVQPGPNGAQVIELPVTPDGDFDRPWPGGFFAERFQELP